MRRELALDGMRTNLRHYARTVMGNRRPPRIGPLDQTSARALKGNQVPLMKTIATASAVAFLVVLTGCDGGSPATKPVQKNEAAPAAGTVKSPNEGLKDRMKSAEGAGAAAAAGAPKKTP